MAKIKFGRNFTNTFTIEQLSDDEREAILNGKQNLFALNAFGSRKFKTNVENQINIAKKLGVEHIELDEDVPSPYPDFSRQEREKTKKLFNDSGITCSVHLPYTMSASSNICSLQKIEREAAIEVLKKYIDFAGDIGALYLVIHPGRIPFYFASEIYIKMIYDNLVETLSVLASYSSKQGLILHMENNTAFDSIGVEVDECIDVVERVRKKGGEIYFNFDIGHWFTRAKTGKKLPDLPENIMKEIPQELVCELHLNDYIVSSGTFHPPLVGQEGEFKRKNMENYAELTKKLNPELIVVETAFHSVEQIKNRWQIIQSEIEYLNDIFGVQK